METKICDLCGKKAVVSEDNWKDWNVKNILEVRDLCDDCYSEFRKLVLEFKGARRKQ